MNTGDYQLMAMAGVALIGYIANLIIKNGRREVVREFVRTTNEVYIPQLNRMNKDATELFRRANKSLDLLIGVE